MTEQPPERCRYFLTYTGVKLPLALIDELEPAKLANRITFFRAHYDERDRLVGIRKIVYGEVEMEHRYRYDEAGVLREAEIVDIDGDVTVLTYDDNGEPVGG